MSRSSGQAQGVPDRPAWTIRRWTLASLATIGVVIIGIIGFQQLRPAQTAPFACAGVGLGGPVEPTPERAFLAWLSTSQTNGSLVDWVVSPERQEGDIGVTYRQREPNSTLDRYDAVTVGPLNGEWTVVGACV